MRNIWDALRGARKIEWLLLVAALAACALLLLRGEGAVEPAAQTALEARMEDVLSDVRGAGRVRVLVNAQEQTVGVFAAGQAEAEVLGVVVVAEGAGDVGVALALARAVQTLFHVELERITVLQGG